MLTETGFPSAPALGTVVSDALSNPTMTAGLDRLTPAEREAVLDQVAERYAHGSRFTRRYVAAKLRSDPVHRMVLELAADEGFGSVLDVGCGRGQLALALLEAGGARRVLGLDRSEAALLEARRAAGGLAFRAERQDLMQPTPLPPADTVLLVDVLYQLPTPAQDDLLRRVAVAAKRRVLIRTLDPDRGLRSRFALMLERVARLGWPNAGAVVNARPVAALMATLEADGFEWTTTPCWQGTPFANVLITARRISEVRLHPTPGRATP